MLSATNLVDVVNEWSFRHSILKLEMVVHVHCLSICGGQDVHRLGELDTINGCALLLLNIDGCPIGYGTMVIYHGHVLLFRNWIRVVIKSQVLLGKWAGAWRHVLSELVSWDLLA